MRAGIDSDSDSDSDPDSDNDLTGGNPPYPYSYSYSYSYSPHHRVRVRFWAELEVVRKGFPNLPSAFPSGEPREEAQRRGGVFDESSAPSAISAGDFPIRPQRPCVLTQWGFRTGSRLPVPAR